MTKKQWLIRLMQGMVGTYSVTADPMVCWYNGEEFRAKVNEEVYDLDINWIPPDKEFRILDQKGIPMEDINICNLD